MIKKYTIKSVGAGMLMHSTRTLNPRDEITLAQKAITKKGTKNRTEEDTMELQRLEFVGGLYHDDAIGPYLPAEMIEACLRDAAKGRKLGKETTRSLTVIEDKVRLDYDGPRTVKSLWEKSFFDARSVKVGQSRVTRTRPHFSDWSATFSVQIDTEFLDERTVDWMVDTAGSRIGIGDFRPRFGRFERVSE